MDKHPGHAGYIAQDMVGAPANDDARALRSQTADNLGLVVKQVVVACKARALGRYNLVALITAVQQGAQVDFFFSS